MFDADDMRTFDALTRRAAREREKRKLDFNDTRQYKREMPITSPSDRCGINSTSIQVYLPRGRTSISAALLLIDSFDGQLNDADRLSQSVLPPVPFPHPPDKEQSEGGVRVQNTMVLVTCVY